MGADEHELRLRPGGTLSTSLNTWRGAKVFVPGNHLVAGIQLAFRSASTSARSVSGGTG